MEVCKSYSASTVKVKLPRRRPTGLMAIRRLLSFVTLNLQEVAAFPSIGRIDCAACFHRRFRLTKSHVRHIYYYNEERFPHGETRPPRPEDAGTKTHRYPQSTPRHHYRSPFPGESILRRRDLLQVRYEMLRRHTAENMSILDAAATFGVSRPTFYQAQSAFNRSGLAGLLPRPRGPKGGHKVTAEVLDYVANLRAADPSLTTVQCVQAVQQRFGITIHRRSLERAQGKKKRLHRS